MDGLSISAAIADVLEARGLDVSPATIRRFADSGDSASAIILNRIYHDDIRHIAVGVRWFEAICESCRFDPASHWQTLVSCHFRGSLKPPFNDSARDSAGLTQHYYAPIALV